MTKPKRYERITTLCVAALGILLWSSAAGAAFKSFQKGSTSTKRTQKTVATSIKSGILVEQFSFVISDFKIDHQGEKNTLNINLRYRYKANLSKAEYPDFTLIAKDIETLLTNYPNEDDYWEIVNKRITLTVLEKYPAIVEVTSQIEVAPTPTVRWPRTSIVTRDRTNTRQRLRTPPALQ